MRASRRSPLAGDAVAGLCVQNAELQSKSFRPPSEGESLFSEWPEKSNQKRGHPDGAPCGHPALRVRGWATGFFDSTSCAGEKLAGILAGHPAGFPSPARRAIGAPGRAARSQRALFRRARSRAGAKPPQSHSKAMLCCGFCFSASSPSAGHDGPLLYPGSLVRR